MHLDENRVVWMEIRSACKGLLNSKDYERYRELNDRHVFTDGDENRLDQWEAFLENLNPDDEEVASSDYEGEATRRDDLEIGSKAMRERVIAYHQLKAFSLFLEDRPVLKAGYREFLVSIYFSMVLACITIVMIIISHHHLFRRCSTVVRLLQTGRPRRHWC